MLSFREIGYLRTVAIALTVMYVSTVACIAAEEASECQLITEMPLCLAAAGCGWCNSTGPCYAPYCGQCYSEAKNETCCQGTSNGQDGGLDLICNASSTCVNSTVNSHYGPFVVPACCTTEHPVGCNGQCYPRGFTCCNVMACPDTKTCCTDGFQAARCCEQGGTCCTESWEITCCPAKSACNYSDYPPSCAATSP